MASGPPEHHVDRLGHRLADRSCNFVLAAENRLALPIGRSHISCRRSALLPLPIPTTPILIASEKPSSNSRCLLLAQRGHFSRVQRDRDKEPDDRCHLPGRAAQNRSNARVTDRTSGRAWAIAGPSRGTLTWRVNQ